MSKIHLSGVSSQIPRPELELSYGLPVFSYFDVRTEQLIYTTSGGFVGTREIGRLPIGDMLSIRQLHEMEETLLQRERPEDWSI